MMKDDLTEEEFDQMMEKWKTEGADIGMKDMMQEWGKLWEQEANLMGGFQP